MNNINDSFDDNSFGDDPNENLRIENELLHLKIKAEFDVETGNLRHPSPNVENQFLKQVLAFEQKSASFKKRTVYEIIGRPDFKKADEMDDDAMDKALKQLLKLLYENNIEVIWGDQRDIRVKYRFVTEEIFDHEMHDPSKDDYTARFDYDRFHPDHEKIIRKTAVEFLSAWFKQDFSEKTNILAERFILPNKSMLSKKELMRRLRMVFDSYSFFADEVHEIENVVFKLKEENDTGLGHVDGAVKYTAIFENGEKMFFDGPFSLFMAYGQERWQVFYFIFPGFTF